jgi:hypothetical protein
VTRKNIYTSKPAIWDTKTLNKALTARIVAFASPSAVRVWAERVGVEARAVVIGPTTAAAARNAGFKHIHCASTKIDSLIVNPFHSTSTGGAGMSMQHSDDSNTIGLQSWANLIKEVANAAKNN